ncbi:MAG: type II toxin-antitoxin system HicB family antitoxin [Spirochaetales bacterium]|nr:type II toxin-antitoxin system HicB family antitoxin [Spirochaetales bacterium]
MEKRYQLPILTEKDEDGVYVVECPVFSGCYSQGRTMDEALKNIREVIDLCLEEKENKEVLENFHPQELIFSTLSYA